MISLSRGKLQNRFTKNENGYFLVSVIVMTTVLTGIGLSIAGYIALQYQHTVRQEFVDNASQVAEAGIEQTVDQLNSNSSFSGYTTAQSYFNNSSQGYGTFTTTITTNADNSKTILSTSKIYQSASSTSPYITRKVQVIAVGTTSGGYSVSSGPGGLILGGSASITNSNVYVNGTITLTGAASIGTQANPVTVDAGNITCPTGSNPGSTYPKVCTTTQPISMAYSTKIWGTVCATGQTSTGPNNNIAGGSTGTGLTVGCTAPVVSQPVYNRSSVISGMTTTASGTSGTYGCSGTKSISIPANTELTGNIDWGNSCKITVNGNLYIPGNLSMDGAATVTLSNTTGSTRPVIVVDGTITVGGSASLVANSSGAGMDFVSFANCIGGTNTSCKNGSSNPAATPTGTDLYNSQLQQDVNIGGAGNTPGMIFDAYWSEISVSGSGRVGAAAGQTVNLSGAGTVIFGTSLASGNETWSITSYQPIYH